jgi:hypothetical protein
MIQHVMRHTCTHKPWPNRPDPFLLGYGMAQQSEQSGGPSTFSCETRGGHSPGGVGHARADLRLPPNLSLLVCTGSGAARNFLSLSQGVVCLSVLTALVHCRATCVRPQPACVRALVSAL